MVERVRAWKPKIDVVDDSNWSVLLSMIAYKKLWHATGGCKTLGGLELIFQVGNIHFSLVDCAFEEGHMVSEHLLYQIACGDRL